MQVCVVGLGKIGLPLAALCAANGHDVTGCDLNPALVAAINRGECPLLNEPEIPEMIAQAVGGGTLRATTDTIAAASAADVVVVVVPLVTDELDSVDYSSIDAAISDVGRALKPGTLVVIETTVPVGDTRQRFGPLLEHMSGLRVEEDFFLAFSPERVQSNRVIRDLNTYPKVVGGVGPASTRRASDFYTQVLSTQVLTLSSCEAAEFTKLAESVYRDVNIALANQLARYAEQTGVDMAEIIPAANSEPLSHLHRPGLGVGGHCIPVYPHFMLDRTDELSLVALAREVNDRTPLRMAARLEQALGGLKGQTVLILGFAYRANVKESFLSPSLTLGRRLEQLGARVLVNDPLFSQSELWSAGFESVSLEQLAELHVDAVVLSVMHSEYASLDLTSLHGCQVVLDGAGTVDRKLVEGAEMVYLRAGLADVVSSSSPIAAMLGAGR